MAQRKLKLRATSHKLRRSSDAGSFITDPDDNTEIKYYAELQTYIDMGIEAERFHTALLEAKAALEYNKQKMSAETRIRTLNDIYESFKQWKLMQLQIEEKANQILSDPLAAEALNEQRTVREILHSTKKSEKPAPLPPPVLLQKLKAMQRSSPPSETPTIKDVLTTRRTSPPKSRTYEQYTKVQGMLSESICTGQ